MIAYLKLFFQINCSVLKFSSRSKVWPWLAWREGKNLNLGPHFSIFEISFFNFYEFCTKKLENRCQPPARRQWDLQPSKPTISHFSFFLIIFAFNKLSETLICFYLKHFIILSIISNDLSHKSRTNFKQDCELLSKHVQQQIFLAFSWVNPHLWHKIK